MSDNRPSTSSLGRFVKLGGLVGRVGASMLSRRAIDVAAGRSGPERSAKRAENLVKNATRIVETLGEMKGAAMKVGQMLSLHEGFLPPEAVEVLRALQKEAPRVPSEVMHWEIEGSLGSKISELFADLEQEAYAAASIGQVHRGRLVDGREVAVKIQYPMIREIVQADLTNLKRLFGSLFGLIADLDFEPIWAEVQDRLLEELDYRHEAKNIQLMTELHDEIPEILIPRVIEELSSDRILTMELLEGISPDQACSTRYPQKLKNEWGRVLFELQLRGLFGHGYLHADPNLANFAFRDDGKVIMYDFGCLKLVPLVLSNGYRGILDAALTGEHGNIPQTLASMGVYKGEGELLPRDMTDPYVELFSEILRPDPDYVFGENEQFYNRIIELGVANWSRAGDLRFPRDVVFIDRTMSGHFGNLGRLQATGPWRQLVEHYVRNVHRSDSNGRN